MKRRVAWVGALVIALAESAAGQPQVSNGELRPAPLRGTLDRALIESIGPAIGVAWAGYAVPIIDGEHQMCCWSNDSQAFGRGCRLEPGQSSTASNATGVNNINRGPVLLEGGRLLYMLFRLENGRVDRIRMFSEDCALDAGGLTVHWLGNVPPVNSVALVASFAAAGSSNRMADAALSALAMHREPAALERLLTLARSGSTTHVRGQALFWLAQRAGDKAVGAIADAIDRDPETEVKKRAVFALSQLPKDEGVPRLIDVARTNKNAAVRKQAMFWLGQSKDARALQFFTEILFK